MATPRITVALCVLMLVAGCRSAAVVAPAHPRDAVQFTVVDDSVPPDAVINGIVDPYRSRLEQETSNIIGYTSVELTKGRPEGKLGNLAADAMLSVVQGLVDRPVHMALTNNGGLRTTVGPGNISVGRIFELMPFENMLVVLDLTAIQVDSLAQQLARNGGDPIAGFSFDISGSPGNADNIRVGELPLDRNTTYRIVTSDYLAGGGGPYRILTDERLPRVDLPFLLRDAIIEYIRETQEIEPVLEGRIRIAGQ